MPNWKHTCFLTIVVKPLRLRYAAAGAARIDIDWWLTMLCLFRTTPVL